MDPPKDDIKAEPISYDGSVHEGSQSQYDTDDAYLKSLGKSAELHRVYNFWTLCAYQVMISATWTCVVVFYGVIFDVGGPASLLYGSIIVAVGQTLLMASLAEYCGIWPTAGGQQFYVQKLATAKYRPFLSYFVGWCLLLAETATGSSCALNTANIIGTMVSIFHPNVEWKPYQTFLIYLGLLVIPFLMNLKPSALPLYSTVGAVFTILGFFGWAITLLATAPKASAAFVFTKFINNSGYSSNGWVFILSFYTPLYGLYGTDSMMHLVEEMKNASQDAPRAMVWSMVLSGVATIVTDLILLFCCGNYTEYVTALSPYVTWFSDVAGSEYAGIYVAIVFGVVNLLVCTGILSSCSRLGWRMAEDRAFPWSHRLQKIDPKLQIPLNFIFAIMVVEVIIGLISLGSELAYNAIVSGAGVCFALAYAIPVTVALVRGRSILPPRPHFDLGRWGYFVNYVAVAWAMLTIVIYVMPLYLPVTGENIGNMNWAALIVGATFLFSGVWWIFGARFRYLKEAPLEAEQSPVAGEQSSSS
ncbi:choline permease [Fusarium circinatum]|uniref:Choline permease n=1 Tax=Fusarium circinatum TaxID=48490 RepID=A0A8H5TVB6_FUSCI|nr:choline permease [Fusarium circinatum]